MGWSGCVLAKRGGESGKYEIEIETGDVHLNAEAVRSGPSRWQRQRRPV